MTYDEKLIRDAKPFVKSRKRTIIKVVDGNVHIYSLRDGAFWDGAERPDDDCWFGFRVTMQHSSFVFGIITNFEEFAIVFKDQNRNYNDRQSILSEIQTRKSYGVGGRAYAASKKSHNPLLTTKDAGVLAGVLRNYVQYH